MFATPARTETLKGTIWGVTDMGGKQTLHTKLYRLAKTT